MCSHTHFHLINIHSIKQQHTHTNTHAERTHTQSTHTHTHTHTHTQRVLPHRLCLRVSVGGEICSTHTQLYYRGRNTSMSIRVPDTLLKTHTHTHTNSVR